ncbi:MAG: imidazole glycerol phosphate synthase subunit HisH [Cytophagales bacterium]|nr:MAG: imidazole glycerol phosphate synthase subunit HisH [Cytophagales bacterium]
MQVAIIKYNAGNTQSVIYALERLGIKPLLSDEPEVLSAADKIIFPGVGEASTAMKFLKERNLDKIIPTLKQPVLGVCLGLQLMCTHTEENNTVGLDIFPTQVKRFPAKDKIPHMGWNNLTDIKGQLMNGITEQDYVYFVHSYYAELSMHTLASCNYILPFAAVIQKDNFYATQFHPEKSGSVGSNILQNFLNL